MPVEAIAHRGLHKSVPENTMDAFRMAVEAGADAIEMDVHATADRVVVVHHDAAVAGTAEDPMLQRVPTGELSIEELGGFDLGGGARVPRLAEVLDYLRDRARVYVEIKGWEIEELVVRCVRDSGADCAIHSFNKRAIERVAVLAPEIPRGLLEETRPADPGAVVERSGIRDMWPHHRVVDRPLVQAVHERGGRVIAWTANDAAEWARLAALGVDGICTDRLEELLVWRSDGSA